MPIDIPTVYLVIATIGLVIGSVALFTRSSEVWGGARPWAGASFALIGLGMILVLCRGRIDDRLSIALANALVIQGVACLWTAMRRFDSRPTGFLGLFLGAGIWLVFCSAPTFHESVANRITLFSTICVIYGIFAGFELVAGRGEPLRARMPLAIFFFVHAGLFGVRAVYAQMKPTVSALAEIDPIYGLLAAEPIVLLIAVALLSADLLRERGERALRRLAETDDLTGTLSRRALLAGADALIAMARQQMKPVALLLFDLDHFKEINDRHGHQVGDDVLRAFAGSARELIRGDDLFGRIGGEEFAILLFGVDLTSGRMIADRNRNDFAQTHVMLGDRRIEATVSAGVAVSDDGDVSFAALLAAADSALYAAKRDGRDRVSASLGLAT
jgi:diguanylate cyclase (GGDEF)-like protein